MIEAACKCGKRKRFALTAQVIAGVLHCAAGAVKSDLAGFEVGGQTDRRKIGQGDRSAGNAASAVDHFEAKAVGELIAFSFMHLYKDVFAGLRGDLAPGIDLGPVEDAGMVVEIATGCEQICFGERLIGFNGCDVLIDEALLRVHAAEGQDIAGEDARAFVDVVDNVDAVRVVL